MVANCPIDIGAEFLLGDPNVVMSRLDLIPWIPPGPLDCFPTVGLLKLSSVLLISMTILLLPMLFLKIPTVSFVLCVALYRP